MKITNVEVIEFRVKYDQYRPHHKWGYGCPPEDREVGGIPLDELPYTAGPGLSGVQTITKISTDEGIEGYMIGGDKRVSEFNFKPLLVGEDPLSREKIWTWMEHANSYHDSPTSMSESEAGIIDCAVLFLCGSFILLACLFEIFFVFSTREKQLSLLSPFSKVRCCDILF